MEAELILLKYQMEYDDEKNLKGNIVKKVPCVDKPEIITSQNIRR